MPLHSLPPDRLVFLATQLPNPAPFLAVSRILHALTNTPVSSDNFWATWILNNKTPFESVHPNGKHTSFFNDTHTKFYHVPGALSCPGIALRLLKKLQPAVIGDRHARVLREVIARWRKQESEGGQIRNGAIHKCAVEPEDFITYVLQNYRIETDEMVPALMGSSYRNYPWVVSILDLDLMVINAMEYGRLVIANNERDRTHQLLRDIFNRFQSRDDFQNCERIQGRIQGRFNVSLYDSASELAAAGRVNILTSLLGRPNLSRTPWQDALCGAIEGEHEQLIEFSETKGGRLDVPFVQADQSLGFVNLISRNPNALIRYLSPDPNARDILRFIPNLLSIETVGVEGTRRRKNVDSESEVPAQFRYLVENVFDDGDGKFDVGMFGDRVVDLFKESCLFDMGLYAKYLIEACRVSEFMTPLEMKDLILAYRAARVFKSIRGLVDIDINTWLLGFLTKPGNGGWNEEDETSLRRTKFTISPMRGSTKNLFEAICNAGADMKKVVSEIDVGADMVGQTYALESILNSFSKYCVCKVRFACTLNLTKYLPYHSRTLRHKTNPRPINPPLNPHPHIHQPQSRQRPAHPFHTRLPLRPSPPGIHPLRASHNPLFRVGIIQDRSQLLERRNMDFE